MNGSARRDDSDFSISHADCCISCSVPRGDRVGNRPVNPTLINVCLPAIGVSQTGIVSFGSGLMNTPSANGHESNTVIQARCRSHDLIILSVAVLVTITASSLFIRDDEHVEFTFLRGWPFPELCTSRLLLGIECPGCGLTRSVICLAHGDWGRSVRYHRLGWLIAACVLLQFPYRTMTLRYPDFRRRIGPVALNFGYALMTVLTGDWVIRQCS